MQISQQQHMGRGSFFIEENGEKMAEMTYYLRTETLLIIDHTEVSPALKGMGIGLRLVEAAVEFARKNQFKISPICPFAQSVFVKKAALYNDVYFEAHNP